MTAAFDFKHRHVFVAGGTSGINLGIAEGFARAGARVAVCSRDPAKVDAAVARLQALGDAAGWAADVRHYDAVEAALQAAHERFGPIDVMVSGAAGNFVAPALGMSSNGFRTVVEIDLIGSFNALRASHAFLRKPGASLINISSDHAQRAYAGQVHVCAAKAGIDQLTRVLALEWGPQGIRVNSVLPGPVEGTEGMRRLTPTPEAAAALARQVPLGQFGQTDDIANACLFLSSPLARYITGVTLPVDGGMAVASGFKLG